MKAKKDLWTRFCEQGVRADDGIPLCFLCPYAEKYEVGEQIRVYLQAAYRNHPDFRNGKLYRNEYRPQHNDQCQMCFEGWIEETKYAGKICIRCGEWTGRKVGMQIIAKSEYEDGTKEKQISAVCEECSLKAIERLTKGSIK